MTNAEVRMTKECRSPNDELGFGLRHLGFLRHFDFDIRHCLRSDPGASARVVMPFCRLVCHAHVRMGMFPCETACPRRRGHGTQH